VSVLSAVFVRPIGLRTFRTLSALSVLSALGHQGEWGNILLHGILRWGRKETARPGRANPPPLPELMFSPCESFVSANPCDTMRHGYNRCAISRQSEPNIGLKIRWSTQTGANFVPVEKLAFAAAIARASRQ
jgi:hypothetical protein